MIVGKVVVASSRSPCTLPEHHNKREEKNSWKNRENAERRVKEPKEERKSGEREKREKAKKREEEKTVEIEWPREEREN